MKAEIAVFEIPFLPKNTFICLKLIFCTLYAFIQKEKVKFGSCCFIGCSTEMKVTRNGKLRKVPNMFVELTNSTLMASTFARSIMPSWVNLPSGRQLPVRNQVLIRAPGVLRVRLPKDRKGVPRQSHSGRLGRRLAASAMRR